MRRDEHIEKFLSVGCSALFHADPTSKTGPRYNTAVRGWRPGAYVLLDRPTQGGRYVMLSENERCVIRFVDGGFACAFDAVVYDWDNRPSESYCRVSWPAHIETVAFRKYERIKVNVPCEMMVEDAVARGIIEDMSLGGCRIQTEEPLPKDTVALLSFTLPDGHSLSKVKCIVRNVQKYGPHTSSMGCEFIKGQVSVETNVSFYIATALGRDALDSEQDRILVIDDRSASLTLCKRLLSGRGLEAVAASGTLDGVSRLRISPPRAVMIGASQGDFPCVETVRLIRATHDFESLPVYVFGAEDERSGHELRAAGATQVFSASQPLPLVVSEVVRDLHEGMQPEQPRSQSTGDESSIEIIEL